MPNALIKKDFIVIGAGIAGLTLAHLLSRLGKVVIIDQSPISSQTPSYDDRVFAITRASEQIFKHLGIWDLCSHKTPYQNVDVWIENTSTKMTFSADELGQDNLGYFLSQNEMRHALIQLADDNIELMGSTEVDRLDAVSGEVFMTDSKHYRAQIIVGCDGANSTVRNILNIPLYTKHYQQMALTCFVETEKHHTKALQIFNDNMSLAFLPYRQGYSIVWTGHPDNIKALMDLDDEAFLMKLGQKMGDKDIRLRCVHKRFIFPLKGQQAGQYVKDRVALAGDAIHTTHPLAGLGLNIGLLDVACLFDVIQRADLSTNSLHPLVLRKYERWRKHQNFIELSAIEVLRKLFITPKPATKAFRNIGMGFSQKMTPIRFFYSKFALASSRHLPEIAQLP